MSIVDISVQQLMARAAEQGVRLAESQRKAEELRDERAALMRDWHALVGSYDFDAIAARTKRLAEIDHELMRMGL